jgi:hypothetical protein
MERTFSLKESIQLTSSLTTLLKRIQSLLAKSTCRQFSCPKRRCLRLQGTNHLESQKACIEYQWQWSLQQRKPIKLSSISKGKEGRRETLSNSKEAPNSSKEEAKTIKRELGTPHLSILLTRAKAWRLFHWSKSQAPISSLNIKCQRLTQHQQSETSILPTKSAQWVTWLKELNSRVLNSALKLIKINIINSLSLSKEMCNKWITITTKEDLRASTITKGIKNTTIINNINNSRTMEEWLLPYLVKTTIKGI